MCIGPTGAPQSVRRTVLPNNSARIQWNAVNCLDANGPIERYRVFYRLSGAVDGSTVTTTDMMLIIVNLAAGQYSIQVAAENSFGLGPFSDPIFLILLGIALCADEHITSPHHYIFCFFLPEFNVCESGSRCDANARCIDTPGSYICLCNQGYSGSGITCDGKVFEYIEATFFACYLFQWFILM